MFSHDDFKNVYSIAISIAIAWVHNALSQNWQKGQNSFFD